MAGYTPATGVGDPSDTGSMADYDQLQATDTSYNDVNIPIPWRRTTNKYGETNPGQGAMGYETETHSYFEATNWLYDQYATDNEGFSKVQLQLAAAGFMGKNPNYTPGTPDDPTQASWSEVLKIAAASDKTPFEILDEAIERKGGMDAALKKANVAQKPDIPLTHPDDIRQVAREMSRKTLGKGWNEKQLNAFVASYQAQEAAAGNIKQGSGVTYTRPPSMEAAAEAEARRQNPVEAGATDWDNAAQMIMKAFSVLGGGSAE